MLTWLKNWFDAAARRHGLLVPEPAPTARGPDGAGAAALISQGNALVQAGQWVQAERRYRQAAVLEPDDAKAQVNLAFVLQHLGIKDGAENCLRRALTLEPDQGDAHYMLGNILEERGDVVAAIACYERALGLNPGFDHCRRDLCRALFEAGRTAQARAVVQAGIDANGQFADFHFYLGNLQFVEQQLDAAASSYRSALSLGARYPGVYSALGCVLHQQGQVDEAVQSLRQAFALDPGIAEAQYQSGFNFLVQGQNEQARANFEMAIALQPDMYKAHANLLCALSFSPAHAPLDYQRYARRYGALLSSRATPLEHQRHDRGAGALRVGFVSGDFRAHPVAFFLEGVLRQMDRGRFELHAFSNNPNDDQITERLKPLFAQWHEIRDLDDQALARRVQALGIDILVDLAGHTFHNRVAAFAWRPAPVQVSWLGYFASTGVREMDYLLADPVSLPQELHEFYSEEIWYLPDTRLCMTPPLTRGRLEVDAPPALRNGYITFGSFQALYKLGDEVLRQWATVMQRLPGSRLRLQVPQLDQPGMRQYLLQRLAALGIEAQRIDTFAGVPWEQYLAAHAEIDLILDSFPFPGGTTTAEALWMGVPTVTLMGQTMLARQGASMLGCAGLGHWVAHSPAQYVDLALRHASDVPALAELRAGLRQQVLASPLFDGTRFARNLEQAFEGMWLRHAQPGASAGANGGSRRQQDQVGVAT